MFNFIFARWKAIKTKYKKFIPFIFTFIFCFSPLSASAYTGDNNNFYPILWHNGTNVFFRARDSSNTNISSRYDTELVTGQNAYYSTINETLSGIGCYFFYKEDSQLDFNFLPDEFDYYFVFTVTSNNELNFLPSSVRVRSKPSIDTSDNIYTFLTDVVSYTHNDLDTSGFTVIGKLPSVSYTSIYGFDIYQRSNVGTLSGDLRFEGLIYCTSKGESNAVGSIISAINNQTNYIVNGDSSTVGIVSGADSSNFELESIVSDYQQIENSMLDNFTLYQSDILSDVTGWSWGGLSVCANWVGDTMTSYFQNMGDFKQYFIYPLLLGIALFFIGRGSSIIGHLYRKPTNIHTDTVVTRTTVKNGNTSNTVSHMDTYRSGGVLRK